MATWTILTADFVSDTKEVVAVTVERPAEGVETEPKQLVVRLLSSVMDLGAVARRDALIAGIREQIAIDTALSARQAKLATLRTNVIGATVNV